MATGPPGPGPTEPPDAPAAGPAPAPTAAAAPPRAGGVRRRVGAWLAGRGGGSVAAWLGGQFGVFYFTCYAVRYPLYVLDYGDDEWAGLDAKLWYSLAQTFGFFAAKFPAFFVVSVVPRDRRLALLLAVFAGQFAGYVGFFALLPLPAQAAGVFLGAFSASWVWGTMILWTEGRQRSEWVCACWTAVAATSGALVRAFTTAYAGVATRWTPLAVAATWLPVGVAGALLADCAPEPTPADRAQREGRRRPMPGAERRAFARRWWPGLAAVILANAAITAVRSYRDFFVLDLYRDALGREPSAADYILADFPGAALTAAVTAAFVRVRGNRAAFLGLLAVMAAGAATACAAAWLRMEGRLGGEAWMVLTGAGIYLCYMPLSTIVYDRLLAAARADGTTVFLILCTDGVAYVAQVSLLLFKAVASGGASHTAVFEGVCVGGGAAVAALYLAAIAWFHLRLPPAAGEEGAAAAAGAAGGGAAGARGGGGGEACRLLPAPPIRAA